MPPRRSPRIQALKKLDLQKIAEKVPASRRSTKAHAKRLAASPKKGRSKARGWHGAAPTGKAEREKLFSDCGAKCFLLPGQLKFPICEREAVSKGTKDRCRPVCQGLEAAKMRARQYPKYKNIAARAEKLEMKDRCAR